MLNTAIVGLGWWGKQIVTSLAGSERIRIARGVDVAAATAPGTVTDFAAAQGFPLTADYDEVLADETIDAVILATPHGLHEGQVLAAAAADKQIFCEKPLALSSAAAERMLAACDARGITLGIGHERRYEGALEELKRMVDEGELGTILHLECNWSHNLFAGNPAPGEGTNWRQDPAQAPAGTLTALGVHITDYMQTLAGPVAELSARMAHRSADFPGDDIIAIQFTFASGITASLVSVATTPFYQRLSVFGDRGWAEATETTNVDKPEPARLTWRGMDEVIHMRDYAQTNTVRANLDAWAGAVAGNGTYRFSRTEKLHNVQILEAIVNSAASGTPQAVG